MNIYRRKKKEKEKGRWRRREGGRKEGRKASRIFKQEDWMCIKKRATYPCLWESEALIFEVSLFIKVIYSQFLHNSFFFFFFFFYFYGGSMGKESACDAGDAGDMSSVFRSRRSPGEGHGNPLQHSCLDNLMDRRVWCLTLHRVPMSQTWLKWLSTIVDLQRCANLCCRAKWLSYTHLYILLKIFFSIMVYHRIFSIVPCAIQ